MTFDLPCACSPLVNSSLPARHEDHRRPQRAPNNLTPTGSLSLVVTEDPLDVYRSDSFVQPSGPAPGGIACGRPLSPPVTHTPGESSLRRAHNRRLAPRSGAPGVLGGLFLDATAGGHLADPEDDEFRGLARGEADLDDQLAGVDDLGRVGLVVALDVERLLGRGAHQGAVAPQQGQERRDRALDALPQPVVVGLEHHPLGGALDARLDHDKQPAHVDVAPRRVARQRTGTPDPDAAVHEADRVDPLGVEQVLLALAHVVLEAERAAHDLVGRGLVDAALAVGARVHAGDVARRGNEDVALVRVVDLDPREVVRAVLGVARLGQLVDAARDGLRRVEDREPILAGLAVRQQRVLHRRRGLAGGRDDRDLVDLVEALEAGARTGAAVAADVQPVAPAAATDVRRRDRSLLLFL